MSAKTINLRGLTDSERDRALNEAVAVMAGWTKHRNGNSKCGPDIPEWEASMWEHDFVPPQFKGDVAYWRPIPPYATSADAVMPLLEKCRYWKAEGREGSTSLYVSTHDYVEGVTREATFPLAACIALLRANGWEVLT